ncbi:MAG: hypothetical protein AVDCRST_MAG54-2929, partial [uncultured Actinomycetospora sp.]
RRRRPGATPARRSPASSPPSPKRPGWPTASRRRRCAPSTGATPCDGASRPRSRPSAVRSAPASARSRACRRGSRCRSCARAATSWAGWDTASPASTGWPNASRRG